MNNENKYLKKIIIDNQIYNLYKLKYFFALFFAISSSLSSVFAAWEKVQTVPLDYQDVLWLDVFFLESDPRYGWTCGWDFNNDFASVLRTSDGGQTWTGSRVYEANQLESIHFVSPLVGYTSGLHYTGSGQFGVIKKTTDGGANWFDVTPKNYSGSLWGNFFINESIGWVVGGGCDGDGQNFFKTTDGGSSWTLFRTNQGITGLTDVIMYSANGLGYASSSGRIWRTTDGGNSWNIMSNSGDVDWQEELTNIGSSFLVPFARSCTGNGKGGGMRFSIDDGRTWREHILPNEMFGAFLLNTLSGWVCGRVPIVYLTSDGGKTWQLKNCGIDPGETLDDIWFINDTTGFVVGTSIYKYVVPKTIYPQIIPDTVNMCPGDSITLVTEEQYEEYFWSTGETTQSITVKNSGNYYVKVVDKHCNEGISNISTVILRNETVSIIPKDSAYYCKGDSLSITTEKRHSRTIWNTGLEKDTLFVSTPGKYNVTVFNEYGCRATDSIEVFEADPQTDIIYSGNSIICETDTFYLESTREFDKYTWYKKPTEEIIGNTKKIRIFESGVYYLVVNDKYGCSGTSDTILVEMQPDSNRLEILSVHAPNVFTIDSTSFTSLSCKRFILKNNSNQPYELKNVHLFKNIEFSAPQNQFPILIEPYDTISVLLCFSPLRLGESRDTLLIKDVCDDWKIPLLSWGKSNIYNAGSKCDVPVKIVTTKLTNYLFETTKPYPNPANDHFRISFYKFAPNNEDFEGDVAIYNTIGIIQSVPRKLSYSTFNNEYGCHITGEYLFDIRELVSGAYFLLLKSNREIKTTPLIIER